MVLEQTGAHDTVLHGRVEEMERRIVMFEELFHAFSSRLDKHFEKYDNIINSQQKQIAELNSVLNILVNDQVRYAEIMKEKLMGSLNGIAATSLTTTTDGTDGSSRTQLTTNRNNDSDDDNDNDNNDDNKNNDNLQVDMFNDLMSNHRTGIDNDVIPIRKATFEHQPNTKDTDTFPDSIIANSKDLISKANIVNESYKPEPGTFQHNPDNIHPTDESLQSFPRNSDEFQHVNKLRKYNNGTNEPFKFLKSPQSVMEVWKEYTDGIEGQQSIKEMETIYQATWRRDAATNKRYSRRKPLWKAIEVGLAYGYTLEYIIDILENARYIDETKQGKHPIGWLSQTANIPDVLK